MSKAVRVTAFRIFPVSRVGFQNTNIPGAWSSEVDWEQCGHQVGSGEGSILDHAAKIIKGPSKGRSSQSLRLLFLPALCLDGAGQGQLQSHIGQHWFWGLCF